MQIIKSIEISGLAKILAQNCVVQEWNLPDIKLSLNKQQSPLLNNRQHGKLKEALQKYLCRQNVNLVISIAGEKILENTPAAKVAEENEQHSEVIKQGLTKEKNLKQILSRGGTLDKFIVEDKQNIINNK